LKKNGYKQVQILVDLNITRPDAFIKGGKWVFVLQKGPIGWKVIDFVHYNPQTYPFAKQD